MANRERRHNEGFKSYRKRLKAEAKKVRQKLAGRLVWCSAVLALDEEESEPPFMMIYKKVKVEGTFDRSKGGKLHGSIAERNKYHRMLDKLKKRGVI